MASEDPLKAFKPSVTNIVIFLFLIFIHVVATYSLTGLNGFPFKNILKLTLPELLALPFRLLWSLIGLPLITVASIINAFVLSVMGIRIFDLLNAPVVFIIFAVYYYFVASVLVVGTIK